MEALAGIPFIGIPFMETNDISVRPSLRKVLIGDETVYVYESSAAPSATRFGSNVHVQRVVSTTTL